MAWTYGDSERLERVRRRATRQKRIAAATLLGVVALVLIGSWWLGKNSAPPPPSVTVTWPSPEKFGTRAFSVSGANGQTDFLVATLVTRRGQPFTILVSDAERWTIHAVSLDSDDKGSPLHWSPSQGNAQYKIYCRPVARGVRQAVAWLWPTYVLRLRGEMPETLPDGRLQIKAKDVFYVASQVTAHGEAAWDDRAIPLLQAEASAVNEAGASHWRLANGFTDRRMPGDIATYAFAFIADDSGQQAISATTQRARLFATRAPTASLKFVLENGKGATFRFAFDGKAARDGWVKRSGETQATQLRWWDAQLGANFNPEPLAPSLPR